MGCSYSEVAHIKREEDNSKRFFISLEKFTKVFENQDQLKYVLPFDTMVFHHLEVTT